MTRSLTSAVKTELATNDIRPVHLITLGFGTPVNITMSLTFKEHNPINHEDYQQQGAGPGVGY